MHTLQDWPRNEAFSFTMPATLMTISNNEIKDTILRIYREWRLRYSPIEYFPWGELAHGVDWRWHDKKSVPLPRRLAAELYKHHQYKLSSKFWGELGNMLRERIPINNQVVIRITNQFDWENGMFGDGGSCMWDGRGATRKAMAASGKFLALQFFSPRQLYGEDETMKVEVDGKYYYSQARCWVYPTDVTIHGTDEYIVAIFNVYGGIPLASMATIVQGLIEADGTKQINISNNGRTSGGIYVNSGQGRLCGSETALKVINHLDFSFKNNYDGGPRNLRRRGTIVATGGAILNSQDHFSIKVAAKKSRKFNTYEQQRGARETLRKKFIKSKYNKYASTSSESITDRLYTIVTTSLSTGLKLPSKNKPIEFLTQSKFIERNLKGYFGYRGSTRSEMHMFDINRSRLANLTGWHPSLDGEFPRWNSAQRKKFAYNIVKYNYNIWTYITHNLSQLITEV